MDFIGSSAITVITVCTASSLIIMSSNECVKKYIKYIVVLTVLATVVMPLIVSLSSLDLRGFSADAEYDAQTYKSAAQSAVVRAACGEIADKLEAQIKTEFNVDDLEINIITDITDISDIKIISAIVYMKPNANKEKISGRLATLIGIEEVTVIER